MLQTVVSELVLHGLGVSLACTSFRQFIPGGCRLAPVLKEARWQEVRSEEVLINKCIKRRRHGVEETVRGLIRR